MKIKTRKIRGLKTNILTSISTFYRSLKIIFSFVWKKICRGKHFSPNRTPVWHLLDLTMNFEMYHKFFNIICILKVFLCCLLLLHSFFTFKIILNWYLSLLCEENIVLYLMEKISQKVNEYNFSFQNNWNKPNIFRSLVYFTLKIWSRENIKQSSVFPVLLPRFYAYDTIPNAFIHCLSWYIHKVYSISNKFNLQGCYLW